jgi:NAD(P)H-dependent FMN reductase
MSHKIAVVLGTAREANNSQRAFKFIVNSLKEKENFEITPVEVSDHLFGKTTQDDSVISDWKNVISNSDAVIFVTPEYNHSYPGELKILIDSLYEEYENKVAGIVGVSMGPYAGVRVTEALKILLLTVNFDVVNRSFDIGKIQDVIDEEGNPTSENKESLQRHLDGLVSAIVEKIKS